MEKYVDGFVIVVPKNKREDYKKMANEGRDMWMRHGALAYYECVGDDLSPKQPEGVEGMENMQPPRTFLEMAGANESEEVWFSCIVFESKERRDEINRKVMEEMNEKYKDHTEKAMPFEMNKMAYGGFRAVVEG